jgi:hypothetical protein
LEKVDLLFSELDKNKGSNFIKIIIGEIIILFLAIGSLYSNLSKTLGIVVCSILLGCFIVVVVLYKLKLHFFEKCKALINTAPKRIIDLSNKRKAYFFDIIDFSNEKLIFREIIRFLTTYEEYPDRTSFGSWELLYNKQQTEEFYQKLSVNKPAFNLSSAIINNLKNLGIDVEKVYDIWTNKIGKKDIEYMYPVYGLLVNDSQVLRKGLKYNFLSRGIVIKPYERKLANKDVIMFHVKLK